MPEEFSLLPNARTSITSLAETPTSSNRRLRFTYDLQVVGQSGNVGTSVALSGEIRGPGDITGIDPHAISRVEPAEGLKAFEPNYMPFVEFVDADFPWRYSLSPGLGTRVLPWIVLIALKSDEFEFLNQIGGTTPRIRVFDAENSLPDLSQGWAFPHVQVAMSDGASSEEQAINDNERSSFSRLLCPRKLDERQSYSMFLVPTFESGRQAGLGISNDLQAFDQLSWSSQTTGSIELPTYFQSRFQTSVMEDVESLARRLRPIDSDEQGDIGKPVPVDSSSPGYYAGYNKPGATFARQSALVAPNAAVEGFNTDDDLVDLVIPTLEEVIKGEADDDDGEDPLVAFPPYGWRFKPNSDVSANRAKRNQWFDRINLDLKFRHVAGVGSRTVAHFQDELLSICWQQYDEVLATNRALSALAVSNRLTSLLVKKHFDRLPSDISLSLGESLQGVVQVADSSVREQFLENGTPTSFASRALRRQSSKRTVRITADGVNFGQKVVPAPAIPGDTTVHALKNFVNDDFSPNIDNNVLVEKGLGQNVIVALSPLVDVTAYQADARPRQAGFSVRQFSSQNYSKNIGEALSKLPRFKMLTEISGLSSREQEEIKPIFRSPVVSVPMARLLAAFDKDALLPNSDDLPMNTASFFVENRRFIESFEVGANHQINNALRFAEFPIDMRGTVLKRFWDRGSDQQADDIPDIHTWSETLGNNFSAQDADRQSNVVVVIKGEIIRKLGQMIVLLNVATSSEWVAGQGKDHEPAFSGMLDSDTVYYGFDVSLDHIESNIDKAFFVMYEPAGRLRFGLDVATTDLRRLTISYRTASLAFPIRAFDRDPNTFALQPPASPTTTLPLDSWDQFSWRHVRMLQSNYIDFTKNISIPGEPNYWASVKTSASVARSFWQKPLGVVIPVNRIL